MNNLSIDSNHEDGFNQSNNHSINHSLSSYHKSPVSNQYFLSPHSLKRDMFNDQSTNHSLPHSTNETSHDNFDQFRERQSIDQSNNPSMNQNMSQFAENEAMLESINRSINFAAQSLKLMHLDDQSIGHSNHQSVHQSDLADSSVFGASFDGNSSWQSTINHSNNHPLHPTSLITSQSNVTFSPSQHNRTRHVSDNPPNNQSSDQSSDDLQRIAQSISLDHDISIINQSASHPNCNELLKDEGCIFCLNQIDEENQLTNQTQRYALVTCRLIDCQHLGHLNCLVAAIQQQSIIEDNLSVHQSIHLDPLHSTNQFRVIGISNESIKQVLNQSINPDLMADRSFSVELGFSHIVSNARQSSINFAVSQTCIVSSSSRYRTVQNQSVYVRLVNEESSGLITHSDLSPSGSHSINQQKSLRFRLPRGKLSCRAVDCETQETIDFVACYDMSSDHPGDDESHNFWKLVYVNPTGSRHCLIIVIGRSMDGGYTVHSVQVELDLSPSQSLGRSRYPVLCAPVVVPSYGSSHHSEHDPSNNQSNNQSTLSGLMSPSSFNPGAREFVPSFGMTDSSNSQHRGAFDASGEFSNSSVSQSLNHSGTLSGNNSPFLKARTFASAPVSHQASPLPSSRSMHYHQAVNPTINQSISPLINGQSMSPSHMNSSLISPSFDASQRFFKQTMNSKMMQPVMNQSNGTGSARGSPQSFNRHLGPPRYQSNNPSNDWDDDHNDDDHDDRFDDPFDDQNNDQSFNRRGSSDPNEQSPLFLPALPTFPAVAPPGSINQSISLGPNPLINLSIDHVRGNVMRIIKSHAGSRFIQQKLEMYGESSAQMNNQTLNQVVNPSLASAHQSNTQFFLCFYEEMHENLAELMIDAFAHFAVEKMFVVCSMDQSVSLLTQLSPSICSIACQKHGSFSVQALIDCLALQYQTMNLPNQAITPLSVFFASLQSDLVRLLTHASGHFVVLRVLARFPTPLTRWIDDCLFQSIHAVGTDHHGLRVVKAVLALRKPTELSRLFKAIARCTMKFVENQYGNYAIQSVLDCAPIAVRTNIKVKMEGKFMRLSKQKFSSNVVEKCLKQSSIHWRSIIIGELISQPAIGELLRDRYGNYVLQTALQVANSQQVSDIQRAITPYLPALRENVRAKWKKMLKRACQQGGSNSTNDEEDDRDASEEEDHANNQDDSPASQHAALNLHMHDALMNQQSYQQQAMNQSINQSSPSFMQRSMQSNAMLNSNPAQLNHTLNQTLNQSYSPLQSFNTLQSLNHLQSMNQSITQSMNQSLNQSINQFPPPVFPNVIGPGGLFASHDQKSINQPGQTMQRF